jgi:hypothetical protein
MSSFSFCLDTTDRSLVEHLGQRGWDVWCLDWRSSPDLPAHLSPYTMADVARWDWPSAVAAVREATGAPQVAVFAHCLSSVALHLALLRGHLPAEHLRSVVASQVGLHLLYNPVNELKRRLWVDLLLQRRAVVHTDPKRVQPTVADLGVSVLSCLLPGAALEPEETRRLYVTFGDLIYDPQINAATLAALDELIPEVNGGFLRDVQRLARRPGGAAWEEDEEEGLARLTAPMTWLSGAHNEMFVPEATRRTARLARARSGRPHRRVEFPGYGHLDCIIGHRAHIDIFPIIEAGLGA